MRGVGGIGGGAVERRWRWRGLEGGGRNKTPVFEPLFPISKVEQSHIC